MKDRGLLCSSEKEQHFWSFPRTLANTSREKLCVATFPWVWKREKEVFS